MLKKNEYIRTVRRPYPPFYASLILPGSANPHHYTAVVDKPSVILNEIQVDGVWYYAKRELEVCGKSAFASWSNSKKLAHAKRIFTQRERALIAATKKDFLTYVAAYEAYMPALQLIWTVDHFVADAVRTALRKRCSPDEVEMLMSALNAPLRDNFYKQEEYGLMHARDLKKHVREYEWINSRYGEVHPYTVGEARARRVKMNRKAFLSDWKEGKKKLREAIRSAKQLLGRHANLIDLMQFIIFYRTQRTDIMNKSSYFFTPMLRHMAKERGVTYEQILLCTKDEVLHHMPSRAILASRMRDYAIVMYNGRVHIAHGEESNSLRSFFNDSVTTAQQFSGAVAFRGKVRGIARIILTYKDFVRVKRGDILVTSMTTPQMVPIMKKAAAFVTDEGGITCHAAIISREMKKPCIIGTKVATRVLHDGDRVEVDATKGVVRKIV